MKIHVNTITVEYLFHCKNIIVLHGYVKKPKYTKKSIKQSITLAFNRIYFEKSTNNYVENEIKLSAHNSCINIYNYITHHRRIYDYTACIMMRLHQNNEK